MVFIDYGRVERPLQIAVTEGVEAALEHLDGTPEFDDEAYQAALIGLNDERERNDRCL
jgi:hypothetical protein